MSLPVRLAFRNTHRAGLTPKMAGWFCALALLASIPNPWAWARDPGVTDTTIRIGSTLALEGDIRNIGRGMKSGIEAAIKSEKIQGHAIEFVAVNDFYEPAKTVEAAKQLIDQGVFLMLGSVGTPTAVAVLPVLAEHKVPAVGFFWSGQPAPGEILNFRPSFTQEVTSAIEAAIAAGAKPQEICLYVQNDSYGMSGLKGAVAALSKQPNTAEIVEKLNKIIAMPEPNPERNNIGPVGVYQRDTLLAKLGYDSLKQWEKTANTKCRFVATTGTALPIANFMGYTNYKKENWIFSVTTSSGGKALAEELAKLGVQSRVIATSVVPGLDSPLPIVADAHKALGENLSAISLEGFVVGQMFLAIANNIKGEITREHFLKSARSQIFDVGGIKIDFTTGSQGSNLVFLTYLEDGIYKATTPQQLAKEFQK